MLPPHDFCFFFLIRSINPQSPPQQGTGGKNNRCEFRGPSRIPPEAHCFALHLLCKKKEQIFVSSFSSGGRGLTTSGQCIGQQQQQRQWYWSQLDTDKYCNLYPPLSQLHGPILKDGAAAAAVVSPSFVLLRALKAGR